MPPINPETYEKRKKLFDYSYDYLRDKAMKHPSIAEVCIYVHLVLDESTEDMLNFIIEMKKIEKQT